MSVKLYPLDGGAPRPIPGLLPGENVSWTTDPHYVYASIWEIVAGKDLPFEYRERTTTAFKEINPSDETGLCDLTMILFSPNGKAYVYGYTRLLSEIYLVNGLK